jgi:putative aminopeptidase FrvX
MSVPDLLNRLLTAAGPPGLEEAPVGVWREAAGEFAEVTVDRMGSPSARVAGRADGPSLALVGHVDEIALLVSHISDDGFLRVVASGGWDAQVLVGQRVQVLTRNGPVPGVVGRKPPHLTEAEERKKAAELKALHVDVGAENGDQARELVKIGDAVVIAAEPVELAGGRLTSRALDNRLGAYIALEAARRVADEGGAAGPLVAVAPVQEEIGLHGAHVAAYGIEPDVAVVLDVTHATDAPGVEPNEIGKHELGSGPVIARGPVLNHRVADLLAETAEAEGIEHTVEVAGSSTRTDADAVHLSRNGVPTGGVWIPLRYMHSPVEVVQLHDVEQVVRLVAAFALRLDGETDLTRW